MRNAFMRASDKTKKHIEIIAEMIEYDRYDDYVFRDILNQYHGRIPIVPMLLQEGMQIVRTRPNEDVPFFFELSQLSYPLEKLRTDRVALKGHPLFYASGYANNSLGIQPAEVSIRETLEPYVDNMGYYHAFVTQTAWRVKRPIHLLSLPIPNIVTPLCEQLKQMSDEWERSYSQLYSYDENIIGDFLGMLMAADGNDGIYVVTANLVDYLFNNIETEGEWDGVVYPTVAARGLGFNVALKTKVVDEGAIECEGALKRLFAMENDKAILMTISSGQIASDGKITWAPYEKDIINLSAETITESLRLYIQRILDV